MIPINRNTTVARPTMRWSVEQKMPNGQWIKYLGTTSRNSAEEYAQVIRNRGGESRLVDEWNQSPDTWVMKPAAVLKLAHVRKVLDEIGVSIQEAYALEDAESLVRESQDDPIDTVTKSWEDGAGSYISLCIVEAKQYLEQTK